MKISIITAVFNGRATIEDALATVARQRHPDVEHIVVDGGSTDGTVEILARWRKNLAALVSEPDNGIYDALNKGIAMATGDVVGFLHADDVYADEEVLSKIASTLEAHGAEAVFGDLQYVRRMNTEQVVRYWKAGAFAEASLAWGWMPPHPTFHARRRVYERLGGFDTRYQIAADYDCMLRFLSRGGIKPAYIPEVLVKMRLGGKSNRSFQSILRKSSEDLQAIRRNGVGGVGTLACKNLRKLTQFFSM